MTRCILLGAMILALSAASACSLPVANGGTELRGRDLDLPPGNYRLLTWWRGMLLAELRDNDRQPNTQIVALGPQSVQGVLPMYPCDRSRLYALEGRGDELRAAFTCGVDRPPSNRLQLAVFDPMTGLWNPFGPNPRPAGPNGASWNRAGTVAAMGYNGNISGQIKLVTDTEIIDLDLGLGMATGPAWSPTADELAFVGRRSAPRGPQSVNEEHEIFLWDPATGAVRSTGAKGRNPGRVTWSPNGRCLAWSTELLFGSRRLSIVDRNGRQLASTVGRYSQSIWSEDGVQLAASERLAPSPPLLDRVMLFDLPSAVRAECSDSHDDPVPTAP